MTKRKLSHVWKLILELDAWMQWAIQTSIEFDHLNCDKHTEAFEKARNLLCEAFPDAAQEAEASSPLTSFCDHN